MPVEKRGIEAVLAQKLYEVLTKWCIIDVAAGDPSRADAVVLGKPTRELRDEIVISIHMQHPLGPSADKDELVSGAPREPDERPWNWPKEFGGGKTEKIVGAVQINIRQKLSYDEAVEIIASVVERVKAAINQDRDLIPLKDDWGNTLLVLETFQASGHAGGGGEVSINLRWIDWRAFIARRDCRT